MTVFCKGNYNIKDTEKFRVLNFKNVSQLVYSSQKNYSLVDLNTDRVIA